MAGTPPLRVKSTDSSGEERVSRRDSRPTSSVGNSRTTVVVVVVVVVVVAVVVVAADRFTRRNSTRTSIAKSWRDF